jgi:hypothetical protein
MVECLLLHRLGLQPETVQKDWKQDWVRLKDLVMPLAPCPGRRPRGRPRPLSEHTVVHISRWLTKKLA